MNLLLVGIADLVGEGHRVLGRGEAGDAVLPEGLEVVDGAPGQLAQRLLVGQETGNAKPPRSVQL